MTRGQVARAIEILTSYPDDYARAAKEINCSRADLLKVLALPEFADDLLLVKDSYLDSLTSSYKNWIRGSAPSPDFNGAHALKVLERERPEIWSAKIEERGKASDIRDRKPKKLLPDLSKVDFNQSVSLKNPVPLSDLVVSEDDLYEFDLQVKDV